MNYFSLSHPWVIGFGGIGRALVALFVANEEVLSVTVITRSKESVDLEHPKLRIVECNIVQAALPDPIIADLMPPSLVINTLGLLHSDQVIPEKRLADFKQTSFEQVMAVNAQSTVLLAQNLEKLLGRKASCLLVALSARVGSISDNRAGGWISYRVSKAALNMAVKTISIEWQRTRPGMALIAYHPGTVDSALSRPFQSRVPMEKLFTPHFAAQKLLELIRGLKATDSGRFFAWDGSEVAW